MKPGSELLEWDSRYQPVEKVIPAASGSFPRALSYGLGAEQNGAAPAAIFETPGPESPRARMKGWGQRRGNTPSSRLLRLPSTRL